MKTPTVPAVTDELIRRLEQEITVSVSLRCPASIDPVHLSDLLAERADLKQQLAAASADAERFRIFAETVVAECAGQEMTAQQRSLFGCMNSVTSVTMDELCAMSDAARAIADT